MASPEPDKLLTAALGDSPEALIQHAAEPSVISTIAAGFNDASITDLDSLLESMASRQNRDELNVRKRLIERTDLALGIQTAFCLAEEQPEMAQATRLITQFANALLHRVVVSRSMLAMDEWFPGEDEIWQEAQLADFIGQHVLPPLAPLLGNVVIRSPGRNTDDVEDAFRAEIEARQTDPKDHRDFWRIHNEICVERARNYTEERWKTVIAGQLNTIREFLVDELEPYEGIPNPEEDSEENETPDPQKVTYAQRAYRLSMISSHLDQTSDFSTDLPAAIKQLYGENATVMDLLQDLNHINLDPTPAPPTGANPSLEPPAGQ